MDGFEADLQALDDAVNKIIPQWLDHAGVMWGKLKLLERGEPSRMTGHGATGSGLALALTCTGFANRYLETANGLIGNAHAYFTAIEAFRDALRQVVESYRKHELRHEEHFRSLLGDI